MRTASALAAFALLACVGPRPGATLARDVEASCGGCQLGLSAAGCDLAIRVDGRVFLVDGTGIDDHGDAHAPDGFCNAIRRARVQGRIEDGRFRAESFELLPAAAPR